MALYPHPPDREPLPRPDGVHATNDSGESFFDGSDAASLALMTSLAEPVFGTPEVVDFAGNNFFNEGRREVRGVEADDQLVSRRDPQKKFSQDTQPDVLFAELLKCIGEPVHESTRLFLAQELLDYRQRLQEEGREQITADIAEILPRNAKINQHFAALREFVLDSKGITFDTPCIVAHHFGQYVVTKAVLLAAGPGLSSD